MLKSIRTFGFLCFIMIFAYSNTSLAQDTYDDHFKQYLSYLSDATDPKECRTLVNERLNKKIKLARIYNEKAGTPSFMIGKWGYTGPDKTEKKAVRDVVKLCDQSSSALFALANAYAHGAAGTPKDEDAAINLFSYLYFAHEHKEAAKQLEKLGGMNE